MGYHERCIQYTLEINGIILKTLAVDNSNNPNHVSYKPILWGLLTITAIWALVFWQGITTAVGVWLATDTFNHCLFVIPGAIYLVYLKRAELNFAQFKPNYFVLVLCVGSLTLYAIGLAGNVQLFMHLATFTFLPLSIWSFIGNKLAYKILFPLCFVLFSIPVGEELVPTLQEVTADLAMVMLNWSGIPVYRSGLYIEIPQGQFLVAEACSGISFFIASIVIGSLYAYLNIKSTKRRIVFMAISVFFPIIANAIRVFGIILTAYFTDMEHAAGADHLIYGWIFFALVIACLLGIGEWIREKQLPVEESLDDSVAYSSFSSQSCYRSMISIVVLMLLFFMWFSAIIGQLNQSENAPITEINLSTVYEAESGIMTDDYVSSWQPEFEQPYQEWQFLKEINGVTVDMYVVWYPKGQGELINSQNRLFPEKAWTLDTQKEYTLEGEQSIEVAVIVNPYNKRLLTHWYVIDGKMFTNIREAKLYEIYKIMLGSYVGSGLVAVSLKTENISEHQDKLSFVDIVRDNIKTINQYFEPL